MRIFDFLKQLDEFFPLSENEDKKNNRFSMYADIIEGEIQKTGKEYDFKKIIQYLVRNYKYKTFPPMPEILDALPFGEIYRYSKCANEGSLLVVTLPTGYQYEFTVSSIGKPLKQLEDDIKRKFGECTYQLYPKGTVIIGGKVYLPEGGANDTTPQSMESPA
ncbi:MAG: hypothetical protein NC408_04630 [Candidatus Gastranaerophilales bacterium]|nr:hypothetical protein [Candidatus Gastranaerophilales bacterium]MCM1072243.1 hypothetical protein [Bacteroides sp.]